MSAFGFAFGFGIGQQVVTGATPITPPEPPMRDYLLIDGGTFDGQPLEIDGGPFDGQGLEADG